MINSQLKQRKPGWIVTGHLWIEYQKREVEVEHQTEDYPQRPKSSFCIYTGTIAEKHDITVVKAVGCKDSPCLTLRYLGDLWIWILIQMFVFWSSTNQ